MILTIVLDLSYMVRIAGLLAATVVLSLISLACPSSPAGVQSQPTPTPQRSTLQRDEPCSIEAGGNRQGPFKAPDSLPKDQAAILASDGPPDAFTIVFTPDGGVYEEWVYPKLGREIRFSDGVYLGGRQGPVTGTAKLATPPFYPWQLTAQPTPACAVKLGGAAVFLTSGIVLPGWNDNQEIARLWALAKGGP